MDKFKAFMHLGLISAAYQLNQDLDDRHSNQTRKRSGPDPVVALPRKTAEHS